ncbi:MAG TPA: class I SAM-dependent methyltransferase, partial [Arenibaculum sp.]|nr:class I SAM-dependent methyltransferase [Arenibaculum sp.]
MRFAPLVRPHGPVLDVACGGGRHLRFFHAAGHPVTGIDVDLAPVRDLAGQAAVELVAADLEHEGWPLPPSRRFAAVVVTNYLHRPLFPAL